VYKFFPGRHGDAKSLYPFLTAIFWFTLLVAGCTGLPAHTGIMTQPASQNVAVLQPATFSVTARGGDVTYQWKKNGTAISGANAST
jgi:hypothetical protein